MLQLHDNLPPVSEWLLLELNINEHVLENSKFSSPLLATTDTAVASDKYVCVCLFLK